MEPTRPIWDFILGELGDERFDGKRVLDVGCRDGLFSFEAERRGAKEVVGIDNDVSPGAVELLIPHFGSKVQMQNMNLYDLTPETFGRFDVIFFFGVLYHLRYPFWGLQRLIDCFTEDGRMYVESGMLVSKKWQDERMMYCPVFSSPYEPTSCTFFNKMGLESTMRSMGFALVRGATMETSFTKKQPSGTQVGREFYVFDRDRQPNEAMTEYWRGTHDLHSQWRNLEGKRNE